MGKYHQHLHLALSLMFILALALASCSPAPTSIVQVATAPLPTSTSPAVNSTQQVIPQTAGATATATSTEIPSTALASTSSKPGVLYYDDFTDSKSGWPESLKFDNYFIGYHEPSYYHVDVHSANDRAVVPLQGQTFTDFTLESSMFTEPNNTAPQGSYRYGVVFRRSGSQYYAFAINGQEKTWQFLKVSPSGTQELLSGNRAGILGRDGEDTLRVDAKGQDFFLRINNQLVAEVSDPDYAGGEAGFFVQTFDIPRVHIHFDTLTIRQVQIQEEPKDVIYQDDFTDSKSGWPESLKFDNYFIGYHEPSYYHVDVHSANDRAVVPLQGQTFTDFTLESSMFTEPNNTAPQGSYRYGVVFRRSGSQYYAFAINGQEKTWQFLKVSPSGTQELLSGNRAGILGRDGEDTLRVDAKGQDFFLRINNQLVAEVSDPDYAGGEAGFFVQTFDIPRVHIHFDTISIGEAQVPKFVCQINVQRLNLRDGPGIKYPAITAVKFQEKFEPLALSADGSWLEVRMGNQFRMGWLKNSGKYFLCSAELADLPIRLP